MRTKTIALQNRLFGGSGTTSGVFGAIGSVHNVCHSICMAVVSTLALFGITTSILPLMFLQTYQLYFWVAAFVFTGASFYFFLKQKRKVTRDRNLLLINGGLLLFGLPFKQLADYMDFFRFLGLSLTFVSLFLFLFAKRFKLVNRPALQAELASTYHNMTNQEAVTVTKPAGLPLQLPKLTFSSALFALVVGGFLMNQYLIYRTNAMGNMNMNFLSAATNNSTMGQVPQNQMKMTAFDIALAKERMDKNNDGICDTCGMPIQQCIDSGQMDCNMGNNPQAIGVLGTAHNHADLNVYNNGERLILAKTENYMKSSFMHLDNSQNSNDANSVLHMHAKKVPLWLFFRSLGMNLTKDSLTLADGQVLKNENGNTLKFYLDGKKVDELGDYTFQPLDKLLISYGPENDPKLKKQIDSLTNFAKDHQK